MSTGEGPAGGKGTTARTFGCLSERKRRYSHVCGTSGMDQMTDRKREVILLSYFMEMSDAAIARKMKLVRSTVHEHRTRSLELLKQIMEENKSECKK